MNTEYKEPNFKDIIKTSEYDFLRTNPHLGNNICLLGLGGSYAYGTNKTDGTSDIDIRGIYTNLPSEILGLDNSEQVQDTPTDTTIYGFNKIIKLLTDLNPNVIELLGLRPEHYLYMSDVGKIILDNKHLFLSKKCIYSFGGYANTQFQRLNNKANRVVGQQEQEKHILETIKHAEYDFHNRYLDYDDDNLNLYIDKAVQDGYDTEIFMDCNFSHYPLRDYLGMWSEMKEILKSYSKIGKRNQHAIEHGKLSKHMMHLFRLYIMAIDILDKQEIITYRTDEHELLMDIRNGKFLDNDLQPNQDFYDLLEEYKEKFDKAIHTTTLPDKPDYNAINSLVMIINKWIVDKM